MRVTPERKALVDFSQSYHTGGDGLVVPAADTKDYKTIGDLKGMAIGAQKGSPQLAEMQQAGIFSDVKSFDSFADVMRAVGKGEIAAGMIGATVVRYEQRLGNFTDVRLVASYRPPGEVPGIAYAVRKSDGDLLSKINTSLAKLQADGTVNKIKANYGL
jgi:polar amino acid transport system substrate-binding protein